MSRSTFNFVSTKTQFQRALSVSSGAIKPLLTNGPQNDGNDFGPRGHAKDARSKEFVHREIWLGDSTSVGRGSAPGDVGIAVHRRISHVLCASRENCHASGLATSVAYQSALDLERNNRGA